MRKHFPPGSPLYRIFNKNTLKLSYSCTKNMRSVIQSHNQKLLSAETAKCETPCNCRNKTLCPVQGNCQKSGVYKATLHAGSKEMTYIGCSNNFKKRYNAHKSSFRHEKHQNATTLSTFIWENGLNPNPNITWEILRTAEPYQPGQRYCQLCLSEKVTINSQARNRNCLNKRSEIAQACRHKFRFRLANSQ